jgi:hypothetical protein
VDVVTALGVAAAALAWSAAGVLLIKATATASGSVATAATRQMLNTCFMASLRTMTHETVATDSRE